MKVIVSQYGARRRYSIPQILERAGVLEALYTDSNCLSTVGKLSKLFAGMCPEVKRLANRTPNIPARKNFSYDGLLLKSALCRFAKNPIAKAVETVYEGSSAKFIKWGVRDADWLYAMFIENFEFTKYAKEQGLKVLADIYEDPYIWDELVSEIELPEYQSISFQKAFYEAQVELRHTYFDHLLETADYYLVPSAYVKGSISRSPSYTEGKTKVIPYSSSVKNKKFSNIPIKGRFIWVGNDPVRKGLAYCERAASILKKKYPFIDFRIIGLMPDGLSQSECYKDLNFIGYCNKQRLIDEFNCADAFIFPTLAEGFAGGILEAASFGVPIITTIASGLASDSPGIFVDRRDVEGIVEVATKVLEDRSYRETKSHEIFEYSQNQTDVFAEEVIKIISESL